MELVVNAPRLLSLPPRALDSSAALSRIASWTSPEAFAGTCDAALRDALALEDASIAALLARGCGIDPANANWFVADPVTLVAGRDDVMVAARVDHLDSAFVARCVERFNHHFGADGLRFVAPHSGRLLMRAAGATEVSLISTDGALGRSLYEVRPRGPDARRFERYANEIQMLLHELPENDARERAGLQPFNGLWIWGGGSCATAGAREPARRTDAFAPSGREGDLARGVALASGGKVRSISARFELSDRDPATTLVVLPPASVETFAAVDARWLGPAQAALAARVIRRLTLIADGDGTWRWIASGPTLGQRVRARWRKRPFAVST